MKLSCSVARLVLSGGHEQAVEKDQRQQLAAQPVEGRVFNPFDGVGGLLGRNVDQLRERALGQREALVDAAHDERGNNGQRERNAQAQGGSLAGAGVDFDFAADFFDVGADHVHAHAAAADVGDGGGGGEAGQKDELQQFALAELGGAVGGDEAALDGLLADFFDGDAGAVVGDFDDDVAAFVAGAQLESSFGILARGLAHFGRFDAVIERVADGVGERVLDGFKQALVELGVLAFDLQAHAAAERLGEVAHDARHLGEDVGDRLHARLHHAFAQVGGDHVEAARQQGHVGVGGGGLQHLVAGEHQLADQVHHAVEQGDVDAQRAFGGGAAAAGARGRHRLRSGRRLGLRGLRAPEVARLGQWSEPAAAATAGCGRSVGRRRSGDGGGRRDQEPLVRGWACAPACARAGCVDMSRSLQLFKLLQSAASLRLRLRCLGLNGLEDGAQAVEQLQQAGDERPVGDELSIAQQAEQVFSGVGQLFQPLEAEESGGSLDRMHGAEDIAEQRGVLRPLFKVGQAPLHAVQPFLALDQELSRQFIHRVHSSCRPGIDDPGAASTQGLYRMEGAQLEEQRSGIRGSGIRGRGMD